jgi:hypothetical protein
VMRKKLNVPRGEPGPLSMPDMRRSDTVHATTASRRRTA